MGTSDLAKTLRVPHSPQREGLLYSLSQCVLAAREVGVDILDGVQLDLNDEDALQAVCMQGYELGFDGKTLIHPRQINIANAAFAPNAQAIQHAEEIACAWQKARDQGQGLVVVNGQLIEHFHAEEALRTMAIAEAISKTHLERNSTHV